MSRGFPPKEPAARRAALRRRRAAARELDRELGQDVYPVPRLDPEVELVRDHARGLLLLRGTPRSTVWLAVVAADCVESSTWSDAGQGWVLPIACADRLTTALAAAGARVKTFDRGRPKQQPGPRGMTL